MKPAYTGRRGRVAPRFTVVEGRLRRNYPSPDWRDNRIDRSLMLKMIDSGPLVIDQSAMLSSIMSPPLFSRKSTDVAETDFGNMPRKHSASGWRWARLWDGKYVLDFAR